MVWWIVLKKRAVIYKAYSDSGKQNEKNLKRTKSCFL